MELTNQTYDPARSVFEVRPHSDIWTWRAKPLYDSPVEAIEAAKRIASDTGEPADVGCCARNFARVYPTGEAVALRPWEHFYTDPPAKEYEQLIEAVNNAYVARLTLS